MNFTEFREKLAQKTQQFAESIIINPKTIMTGFQLLCDELEFLEDENRRLEKQLGELNDRLNATKPTN